MYRCENFDGVPNQHRRKAVLLKLPLWSPFANTGHHCVWSGAKAMVWLWDADQVVADAERLGKSENIRVVPETVFYPRKPDGAYVQQCRRGFELQQWRDDVLTDALWQAESPTAEVIARFAGHHGAPDGAGTVPTAPNTLAEDPWSGPVPIPEWLIANERRLATIGIALFAVVASWQEGRIWHSTLGADRAEDELIAIEEELGPLFQQRNEVLALHRRNEALAEILRRPSQAAVMRQADLAVPSEDAEFQEWRYQQGELKLVVTDPLADPVEYVRRLEDQPLISAVEPGPSRGQGRVEFNMRVAAAR